MCSCILSHIPARLHNSPHKKIISSFYVNDRLYRRTPQDLISDPYKSISIAELSHNIGICNNVVISEENDVLLNITAANAPSYDQVPITLVIKDLDSNNKYNKFFPCDKTGMKARMELLHAPCDCMYPHCIFRVFLITKDEEVVVGLENYRATLGSKLYKEIRTAIKHELAGMMHSLEIRQNSN